MSNRPMKAHEIVQLFASLQNIDLASIASVVGNIPKANIEAWLGGKKDNLRQDSVVRLLDLIGLKVGNGVYLDPARVHVWRVRDGVMSSAMAAYKSLVVISRLLKDCAITRVEPARRGWFARQTCQAYLISGNGIRVVVKVDKAIYKSTKVTPDYLVGTLWRDPSELDGKGLPHTIRTTAEKWRMLMAGDLAPFEFDQIFEQQEPKLDWKDVAMAAREYAVTPDMVFDHIVTRHGSAHRPARAAEENSVPLSDGVILLQYEATRRRATGTGG